MHLIRPSQSVLVVTLTVSQGTDPKGRLEMYSFRIRIVDQTLNREPFGLLAPLRVMLHRSEVMLAG